MAFDVYVGTLTRFYRRDWENVAQRTAREQGVHYQVIHAAGAPQSPPPAEELRQHVAAWCEALSRGLQPQGVGPVAWSEADDRPYFTDRPGWEGYAALLVWAAHAEHPDLPLPVHVPRSWADDPAYERSTVREFRSKYRSILEPQLWLPVEFPFVFDAPTLVEDQSCIGSVFTLKQQLDELHRETGARLDDPEALARARSRNPGREEAGTPGKSLPAPARGARAGHRAAARAGGTFGAFDVSRARRKGLRVSTAAIAGLLKAVERVQAPSARGPS